MSEDGFRYIGREGPLLVSMPHVGTDIPDDIAGTMRPYSLTVPDTDWHLDRLYDFLEDIGASVMRPDYSRYVVDLNRSCKREILYPGQSETSVCPIDGFDGGPLYQDGKEPDNAEIDRRIARYWRPYHDKIAAELDRIQTEYGYALLWEAHSIKSHVPRFFDGQLPDLNLGTGGGTTCEPKIANALHDIVASGGEYTVALNGRFKGGYITRHYADSDRHITTTQLEISQITYMNEEAPYDFCEQKAQKLRPILRKMLGEFCQFNPLHET